MFPLISLPENNSLRNIDVMVNIHNMINSNQISALNTEISVSKKGAVQENRDAAIRNLQTVQQCYFHTWLEDFAATKCDKIISDDKPRQN
jgi:hypothetical protein